jgi:hypothetical protein
MREHAGVSGRAFVFGYGSLAGPGGHLAVLRDHARGWGVAMDNTRDLPGYKHYLAADGSRPAVYVAFLDIAPSPGDLVDGVCRPADLELLAALDRRERNYARVDVSDHVEDAPGRTWAYLGTPAGRDRLRRGRERGTAVVSRAYLDDVRAGLAVLGAARLERAAPSLAPGDLPVVELRRVDAGD